MFVKMNYTHTNAMFQIENGPFTILKTIIPATK